MSDNRDNYNDIVSLFLLYEQKMYYIAYAILHDSHQAEDAVMDAFVRLLEHNYRIDDPASDRSKKLVISVTRSASIDLYRKNLHRSSRMMLTEDPALLHAEERQEYQTYPENNAEGIIQALPSIYYDVMYERYIKGKSVSETAAILKISEAAVRKRQERALRILREERVGKICI
ncbi:MAG: RNA polymerase sigma factor [Bilifractor sp.]|jgi:RNA polymerase sigma-70 factor (ECF subfamily)